MKRKITSIKGKKSKELGPYWKKNYKP
jgi:hypothetical protein